MISSTVKDDKDISVTRAVGRFFGHLWGATTKPVEQDDEPQPNTRVVAHEVNEGVGAIEGKKVVLRRTTIDEVEIQED